MGETPASNEETPVSNEETPDSNEESNNLKTAPPQNPPASTVKTFRAKRSINNNLEPYDRDWFWATQAMIVIGLAGIFICLILSALYLTVHTISKNSTILALVILCFLTVIFEVVGYAIFGSYKGSDVNWSLAICVISSIFCLIAGILAIVQMRKSGVRV